MATAWIWLLLLPVGVRFPQVPAVASTARPSARLGSAAIGEDVGKRFGDALGQCGYPFLDDARLETIEREIAAFASRHARESMPATERDALLEAVDRYVPRHFPSVPPGDPYRSMVAEGPYLKFRDVVNTFKWQLWRALTRRPLTPEQHAQRRVQHDWLRDFIAGVPPHPSNTYPPGVLPDDLNAWARRRVERELADPLSLLYDPLSKEQFEVFKVWMQRSAGNGLVMTVKDISVRALGARAHHDANVEGAYAYPFDYALPFDDEVVSVWGGGGGTRPHLAFASNAPFRGQDIFLNGRRRPILETFKDIGRVVCGRPRRVLLRPSPRRRVGDITYDDNEARLIALGGARMAELKVVDWFEADRLSNDELSAVVRDHGVRSIAVERVPPMNGPRHVGINEPRFFLAVRDRAGRLAVIDLRSREFAQLRMVIRKRSDDSAR